MTTALLDPPAPQIDDDGTRRELIAGGLALSLGLAACGGDEGGGADGARTRMIRHALGSTEVPLRPERVATISEGVVAHLASVGLLVVAANDSGVEWVEPYGDLIPGELDPGRITTVGTSEEPNLEALAAVRPELIVIETFGEDLYPQLSQIAPTVAFERESNAAWKPVFEQTLRAVGREREGARVAARYERVVDRVRQMNLPLSVSFVRSADAGAFRIDGTGATAGSTAAEAGIEVADAPAGEEAGESGFVELSGERLRAIEGDVIVTAAFPDGPTSIEELSRNPLWDALAAVRAGRVHQLPGQIYNGGTYVAQQLLLERLAGWLAEA